MKRTITKYLKASEINKLKNEGWKFIKQKVDVANWKFLYIIEKQ